MMFACTDPVPRSRPSGRGAEPGQCTGGLTALDRMQRGSKGKSSRMSVGGLSRGDKNLA